MAAWYLWVMPRRSNTAAAARPPTPRRPRAAAAARPRGGDLRVEDLTPLEQSLGDGRVKTQAEVDAALEALWARARASEEGYVAVRAFDPDDP